MATASGDTTVRIWDLATETPRVTCKGHKHWVQTLAWEPMCQVLASGGMDKEVKAGGRERERERLNMMG